MASNVKITVQEINQTVPLGAGSSTDVVYVPGLVMADTATFTSTKNEPVLCQDIATFQRHFGTQPYKFESIDFEGNRYEDIKNAHDYDPSYIYASELIRAGLPVYYEAIVNEGNATTDDAIAAKAVLDAAKAAVATKATALATAEADYVTAKDAYESADEETKGDLAIEVLEAEAAVKDAQDDYDAALAAQETAQDAYDAVVASNASPLHNFMTTVKEHIEKLSDKGEYTVKYITTGGYPSVTISSLGVVSTSVATAMLTVAAGRQDAVALIDHSDVRTLPLGVGVDGSFYEIMNTALATINNAEFGAMFTPWALYNCGNTMSDVIATADVDESQIYLPASFGYLMCVAKAIKTSPNWLAMAGVTRGIVPNLVSLAPNERLNNTIAEDYQPKFGDNPNNKLSINAITNIKPYGHCIWGNRTLYPVDPKGTTALNFLNTRNMISDIKKLSYTVAKSLMFEQDSNVLWLKFKSGVSPLLDRLVGGYGIKGYKIIKGATKADGTPLTRGEIAATIRIYPLYAVEYFEITVIISDDDVTVS